MIQSKTIEKYIEVLSTPNINQWFSLQIYVIILLITIKHGYYLVGGIPTPLKNMTSSVGIMTFPTEWKEK